MSIWKYQKIQALIPEKYRLTGNEGETNVVKIFLDRYEQKELGIRNTKTQRVYLKMETMNPNRSFKDRSLAYQISYYYSAGAKKLLISSSGNAAISAASYVSMTDMKLAIFVSNKVNKRKLEKLNEFADKNENITIHFSMKPKSDAIKYANSGNYINLRGSVDPHAVTGFKTIAYELVGDFEERGVDPDGIFIPCSSGTSTVGIYEGYQDAGSDCPPVNVCQTEKIFSIAKYYDVLYTPAKTSIADAISDRVAHRSRTVREIIDRTEGSGWILSDEDISKARDFLRQKTKLPDITNNGVLSFAGLVKALKRRKKFENPVCIISGI